MPLIPSIQALVPAVLEAGRLAQQSYRQQHKLGARFKADRTIVTEVDTAVEQLLRQAITASFPGANILGEEGGTTYDPAQPSTFIIDPIDGTAMFVNGAPSWTICVGLLDAACEPVAGIVYAPSWGSLFVADVDRQSPALHNGVAMAPMISPPAMDENTTLLLDSRFHQTHQVHDFPGRCRCFGSTALHLCLVAQQTGFALAQASRVYAWDIAAAHAIAARVGVAVQYLHGQDVSYAPLLTGHPTPDHLVAGHPSMVAAMQTRLRPRLDV